jgi:hypothetical protein
MSSRKIFIPFFFYNNFMNKGIAYSTIIIVALIGILMVSLWSYNQLASGGQYSGTYTSRSNQDIAVSNLEFAKRFLTQNLIFSSQSSSVVIAANGGTQFGATYWYCDSQPNPPEISEVNFAMSNQTLSSLNAYVAAVPNGELSKIGVEVSNYGCVGVYDPGHSTCSLQDSSQCEAFQTSGTQGGTIKITQPAQVQYSGDISGPAQSNRFYWIYYRLYDDTKNNGLLRTIAQGLRADCPNTNPTAGRIQTALSKVCDHYESLLAEPDGTKYVTCKLEVLCLNLDNPGACLNTPCERPPASALCYQTASQSALNGENIVSNFVSNLGGKIVSAQGSNPGVRLKISLTDTKFNIPSSDGMQPLVWNIWAVTQIAPEECRPIDSGS